MVKKSIFNIPENVTLDWVYLIIEEWCRKGMEKRENVKLKVQFKVGQGTKYKIKGQKSTLKPIHNGPSKLYVIICLTFQLNFPK